MSKGLTEEQVGILNRELSALDWIETHEIMIDRRSVLVLAKEYKEIIQETDEGIETIPGIAPHAIQFMSRMEAEHGIMFSGRYSECNHFFVASSANSYLDMREGILGGKYDTEEKLGEPKRIEKTW